MENEIKPSIDLSSAVKFFTDAVLFAYNNAKESNVECCNIKEIAVVSDIDVGESIHETIPGASFKKYYAPKNTKCTDKVCKDYTKLLIMIDGDCILTTVYAKVLLPQERKFFYLNSEDIFSVEFVEDSWFYILSMPL